MNPVFLKGYGEEEADSQVPMCAGSQDEGLLWVLSNRVASLGKRGLSQFKSPPRDGFQASTVWGPVPRFYVWLAGLTSINCMAYL